MRISCLLSYALTDIAMLAVLAGCSSSAGGPAYGPVPRVPAYAPGTMRMQTIARGLEALPFGTQPADRIRPDRAVKDFISPELLTTRYKAFFSGDSIRPVFRNYEYVPVIDIYDFAGDLIGELTHFENPFGLATDKDGRLYVADHDASQIQVIAPPYTGERTILNDPDHSPLDVAVDGNGNVAVTNYQEDQNGGPGNMVFYARGATNPTRSISDPNTYYYNCAFDAYGDLYFDADGSGGSYIGEIVGGINGTKAVNLRYTGEHYSPFGVQVTKNGLISVLDQSNATIYTYKPPTNGYLGLQVAAATPLSGTDDPQTFAFGPLNAHVFVANDDVLDSGLKYAFPAAVHLSNQLAHPPHPT